jgi:anaerobic magnesium-protoporphyrin IX monomethyl ester cyclase
MKILLFVPPNITYGAYTEPQSNVKVVTQGIKHLGAVVTDMPLGPLSLSAYVLEHFPKAEVKILDFNVVLNRLTEFPYNSFKELFTEVLSKPEWKDFDPDAIGISALFSPAYQSMLDLAEVSKDLFPLAWVLGGGFLPTNMYQQIFVDTPHFDALCFGEGEQALVRFLQAQNKADFIESDKSWITPAKAAAKAESKAGIGIVQIARKTDKGKGLKVQDFAHDFLENLDEIPFLPYHLLDLEGYALNPTVKAYPALKVVGQAYHVMLSRGCPYSCSFCAQDTVHGKDMRYYSLNRIQADLKRLHDEFGVRTVVIEDDHFMADPKRAFEILGMLIELGMTACFPNALALYALKLPMLQRIKAVGVDQLVLAVESGSDHVLREIMHKPLKLSIVSEVTTDCRKVEIYTDCNIVIGQPGETAAHFEESRHFLRTTDANWYRINVATPITGSELLQVAMAGGHLRGNFGGCDYKTAVIETEDFTAKGLQKVAYLLNLELNFVYNSDFRLGHYEIALMGFLNALKARPDHYFAHYYAALCYEKLGQPGQAQIHVQAAEQAKTDLHWQKWIALIDAPMAEVAMSK